jgi:hypothetical protein
LPICLSSSHHFFRILTLFILQLKMDGLRSFNGVANYFVGEDLVIVDIPNNLFVPSISNADGEVPRWKLEKAGFLDQLFDFTSTHL